MKHIYLIIFIFTATLTQGQVFKTFYFSPTIIYKGDTIKHYKNFYLTTNSDTIFPQIKKHYFKLKMKDSIVDFHLTYLHRNLLFEGVETFRLIKNRSWQIHIEDSTSDSSYLIVVGRAGCFSNVIIGGRNAYRGEFKNGRTEIVPVKTNRIELTSYISRREFRKNVTK
jgi:hypothetical protein